MTLEFSFDDSNVFLELGELAYMMYHPPCDQEGLSSNELRFKRDTNQCLYACFWDSANSNR